jgi:hypothetical protein
MKSVAAYFLAFSMCIVSPNASAQTADEEPDEYRDGKITLNFEHFPVEAAVNLIHSRAGLQIVLPANLKTQFLTLQLNDMQVEPAVRLLINSIGYRGVAILYDESGRAYRAVVIDTQPEDRSVTPNEKRIEGLDQRLTQEERERLQKQLELWGDLRNEARTRIEERLKSLPPSSERDDLLREYARQVLGIKK